MLSQCQQKVGPLDPDSHAAAQSHCDLCELGSYGLDFSGWPRFGSVTVWGWNGSVWGWNGSSRSGFRCQRFSKEGVCVFQHSFTESFRFLETVPAVPVPRSVPAKTVPTVPVSGSGSVPGPP